MTVTLINCTGKPQHVHDGNGNIFELLTGPRPVILDTNTRGERLDIDCGDTTASIDVIDGTAVGTLFMPEPIDGVLYLVGGEVHARHPHRDDLVSVATYSIDFDGDDIAGALDGPHPIASLHRTLPRLTGDETNIADTYFDLVEEGDIADISDIRALEVGGEPADDSHTD